MVYGFVNNKPQVVVVVVKVGEVKDGVAGGSLVVGKWTLWCGGRWVWVFGDWPLPSWQVDAVAADPYYPVAWVLVKGQVRPSCGTW